MSSVIKAGSKIPIATLLKSGNVKEAVGACAIPSKVTTTDLFKGKKVVLFGLPGAFTPTCHVSHLPGYLSHFDQLKAKNVDLIACVSTNDIFVMDAWGKQQGVGEKVMMVSDGNGELSTAMGVLLDLTGHLMGNIRTARFAAIIDDGIVKWIEVGDVDVSGAEAVLKHL